MGQLFEYHCWPNKIKADEIIIVTQPHKNDKREREYIKHLGKTYTIPLSYQSYDWEKDQLA